ncbi:MAG: TonB-dependent receptor [Thermodesulfobacterium sp. 37_54]|uniref:TonB-dependent receptor n=1 Tax=Thermodesulfobacterium commune TaxID=1741 RepID=A0A117LC85_9BACT|nr:TonB-dependent receptor [Thermodesulfobacterium commune]KUJ97724.1 MAG: TonB-dependent receptor [Thermodesulfobacterium sp. 37_54]KUK18791.1 MAG: TonB-dependent receptor [Thermodesulfobacterium commune]KUK37854.1 MAG: TonB-dependent receptor [Thermodesulfobacterium commune]HAA83790.1 TonB-dependent receptor [Thermodesulfobacterium commune]HCP09808.1 TonB-dependent receptor [Thermodesulfobacterium commune]
MWGKKALFFILALKIFFVSKGFAEEIDKERLEKEESLPEVIVTSEKIITPTKETAETVYTGIGITKKGIELSGERGSSNVWSILNILPGVYFETPDPAGISSTQRSITIRGVSGSLGTMSVEGVPVYGGNPIGPREYIFDLENLEAIDVYRGVIPVDLGTGAGTRGGTVELKPKWAKDKFGFEFKQGLGMNDYTKTFLRVDSGKLPSLGTKLSLSYSYAEADKWRGKGKLGPRENLNFTLVQALGNRINIKLWANYNDLDHHKYATLSYPDAKKDRWLDYNENFTGNSTKDWYYYKYQKLGWTNKDYYAFLDIKLLDQLMLQIKPYYRIEEKEDWSGTISISGPMRQSKPGVTWSGWEVKRKGALTQLVFDLKFVRGLLGYHYELQEWDDRPSKNYWLNPDGSLTFIGWGRFTKSISDGYSSSPYLKFAGNIGKLNWQAGLQYIKKKDGKNEGYITQYNGTVPYLLREPKLDYGGRSYSAWVPSFGLSYSFNEKIEVYTSFGKTFQTPYMYMPIVNLYYRLYEKFKKMGITLDDLFNDYKCEETYNWDLGLRIRAEKFELYPTVYFSKHKNLNTPFTPGWKDPDNPAQLLIDPSTGRPVSFNTFIGKARGYGFELASTFHLTDKFSLFFNPSYVKMKYDGDIISAGTRYPVDGKQVIGVPEKMLTTGLIARYKGFEIVPRFRYVGSYYGNLARTEKVSGYEVFDLMVSYNKEEIRSLRLKNLRLTVEFNNLFDRRYIFGTSNNYYPGTPFNVFGSISFNF